jgi:hypothetical protein
MRLPRGWHGLLLFWIGVLSLCGAGAAALQVLGPADRPEAAVKPPVPSPIQLASLVPLASSAAAPVSAPTVETPDAAVEATARPGDLGSVPPASSVPVPAAEAPREAAEAAPPPVAEAAPEPVVIAATEPTPTAPAQPTDQQAQATETTTLASIQPTAPQAAAVHPAIAALGDGDGVRRDVPPPRRTVLLRVSRDTKACPTAPCLRWHVVQRHAKPQRASSLDFARLRLAPGLRQAAEGGEIELYIDAIEEHRTVKGRENIVYVATSLAGVTPHDKSP